MSSKITEATWRSYLEAAAVRAVDSKAEMYRRVNKGGTLSDDDKKKIFDDYLAKLKREYPYEKVNQADLDAIDMFNADSMRTFLDQYGVPNRMAPSPTEYQKAAKAADILPLLQGVAKPGNDWYSMGSDYLKEKGAALGYDVRTKEGFKEFLDAISEQQTNYDRAKIQQEAKEEMGLSYYPRKFITPSAMQEFENAIATGGDYDASTAVKFGALDGVSNTAMMLAPGFNIVKSPVLNGMIDAGIQAGVEAGRQGVKQGLSTTGQEFDMSPVLFAGGAGATKPVIVGTVQGAVSRFPGKVPTDVARGISKAVKTGDPVDTERRNISALMKYYNDKVAPRIQSLKKAQKTYANSKLDNVDVGESDQATLAKFAKEKAATQFATDIKKLLGNGIVNKNTGTIKADKVLELYDKPVTINYRLTPSGKMTSAKREWGTSDGTKFELSDRNENLYRSLFPNKYTDEAEQTGASKVGGVLGELLAGYGSRVEPTFKISGTKAGMTERTYKDENWYKSMTPRSKKIIDAAFKKKDEESEEE